MENIRGDMFPIASDYLSRTFIQNQQAWSIRRSNHFVRIVHPRSGIQIQVFPVDKNGTMRTVVGPNACLFSQIGQPKDVCISRSNL